MPDRYHPKGTRLPRLLDIAGVAEHLGVSERHVRRLVAERRIPFIKWGHDRGPWSGGNESVVVILSDVRGGQATSSLCARSTSFGLSSCPVS